MGEIKKLREICEAFKLGRFWIEEFKAPIETVYLPGEYKNTLEKAQHNTVNRLEEIIYCYAESQKDMPTRRGTNCFRCWGGENSVRKLKRC